MTRIVTTRHRYKPPPRKQKAVALQVPAVVTPRKRKAATLEVQTVPHVGYDPGPANDDRKSGIVTSRRQKRPLIFGDAPDLPPDEHQRRGDATEALFRAMVRGAAGDAA